MSDFTYVIGLHHGVTPRTVRRWCSQGKLPGVYRTKGGHYRMAGPYLEQLRRADRSFRTASPELRRIYQATPEQRTKWLKELVNVLLASSILNNGVGALRSQRADVPIRKLLHPHAIKAVEKHNGLLMIHAEMLFAAPIKITSGTLADSLGVPRSTLYSRYGKAAIRKACAYGLKFPPDLTLERKDFAKHSRKIRRAA